MTTRRAINGEGRLLWNTERPAYYEGVTISGERIPIPGRQARTQEAFGRMGQIRGGPAFNTQYAQAVQQGRYHERHAAYAQQRGALYGQSRQTVTRFVGDGGNIRVGSEPVRREAPRTQDNPDRARPLTAPTREEWDSVSTRLDAIQQSFQQGVPRPALSQEFGDAYRPLYQRWLTHSQLSDAQKRLLFIELDNLALRYEGRLAARRETAEKREKAEKAEKAGTEEATKKREADEAALPEGVAEAITAHNANEDAIGRNAEARMIGGRLQLRFDRDTRVDPAYFGTLPGMTAFSATSGTSENRLTCAGLTPELLRLALQKLVCRLPSAQRIAAFTGPERLLFTPVSAFTFDIALTLRDATSRQALSTALRSAGMQTELPISPNVLIVRAQSDLVELQRVYANVGREQTLGTDVRGALETYRALGDAATLRDLTIVPSADGTFQVHFASPRFLEGKEHYRRAFGLADANLIHGNSGLSSWYVEKISRAQLTTALSTCQCDLPPDAELQRLYQESFLGGEDFLITPVSRESFRANFPCFYSAGDARVQELLRQERIDPAAPMDKATLLRALRALKFTGENIRGAVREYGADPARLLDIDDGGALVREVTDTTVEVTLRLRPGIPVSQAVASLDAQHQRYEFMGSMLILEGTPARIRTVLGTLKRTGDAAAPEVPDELPAELEQEYSRLERDGARLVEDPRVRPLPGERFGFRSRVRDGVSAAAVEECLRLAVPGGGATLLRQGTMLHVEQLTQAQALALLRGLRCDTGPVPPVDRTTRARHAVVPLSRTEFAVELSPLPDQATTTGAFTLADIRAALQRDPPIAFAEEPPANPRRFSVRCTKNTAQQVYERMRAVTRETALPLLLAFHGDNRRLADVQLNGTGMMLGRGGAPIEVFFQSRGFLSNERAVQAAMGAGGTVSSSANDPAFTVRIEAHKLQALLNAMKAPPPPSHLAQWAEALPKRQGTLATVRSLEPSDRGWQITLEAKPGVTREQWDRVGSHCTAREGNGTSISYLVFDSPTPELLATLDQEIASDEVRLETVTKRFQDNPLRPAELSNTRVRSGRVTVDLTARKGAYDVDALTLFHILEGLALSPEPILTRRGDNVEVQCANDQLNTLLTLCTLRAREARAARDGIAATRDIAAVTNLTTGQTGVPALLRYQTTWKTVLMYGRRVYDFGFGQDGSSKPRWTFRVGNEPWMPLTLLPGRAAGNGDRMVEVRTIGQSLAKLNTELDQDRDRLAPR